MAWTQSTINRMMVAKEATVTLPASATTGYSSVITFLPILRRQNPTEYVSILVEASAVTGTNVDIGLYGSYTSAGTDKFLLLDAPVADVTNAAKVKGGTFDLKLYPAPYYFIGYTTDADESANTVTITIMRS